MTMPVSVATRRAARLLGLMLALLGVVLAVGGFRLIGAGGSRYYLFAGLVLLVSAFLIVRIDRRGTWLYWLLVVITLVWSVAEVGFDGWALVPRLGLFVAIGLWMLSPWGAPGPTLSWRTWLVIPAAVVLCLLMLILSPLSGSGAGGSSVPDYDTRTATEWRHYGNTLAADRYAGVDQVKPENVARLRRAWSYSSGDLEKYDGFIPDSPETTPIKIGNRLFACSPRAVYALDAKSGEGLWRFEPGIRTRAAKIKACRGVAYHDAGGEGLCSERILWATVDARLFAVDTKTGERCPSFGNGGEVDLTEGMGEVKPGYYFVTSPPLVAGDKALVGGFVDDNADIDVPSGVVRAYDALSGRLAWAWDMGRPDRRAAPAPGETYTRGSPNAWGTFSADPELGLAYIPTGNPSPDFWGGKRRDFDERYGSSVVALALDDGRVRWSFQTVHHDLWDYDVPAAPSLVDLESPEGAIPALVQPTKQGELFLLDRRTGEPLAPVMEKPVPRGGASGDRPSPTQPFSVDMPDLRLPELQEADMWGATPIDQMVCRIWFREARYQGIYTPPDTRRFSLTFPGSLGATDWGGVSIDRKRNILVANSSNIAYRTRLIPRDEAPAGLDKPPVHGVRPGPGEPPVDYWYNPQIGTPYVLHTKPFLGPLYMPCNRPPWGMLTAIDLATRKTLWRRPLGTGRDSGPLGYPSLLPLEIGTPNIGGTLVTGSGLIFFGGTLDRYLRAFDIHTGEELWKARLPAGGQATPMTYVSAESGRQFIVISAGGHVGLDTRLGDWIVAYALPETDRE